MTPYHINDIIVPSNYGGREMITIKNIDELEAERERQLEAWIDTGNDVSDFRLDLSKADLICAQLGGADLKGADLIWAQLDGADLKGADLTSARFVMADLSRADLRGAILKKTSFANAFFYKTASDNIDYLRSYQESYFDNSFVSL